MAASLRETASTISGGYWMLPTTTLSIWKGLPLAVWTMRFLIRWPSGLMLSLISSPLSCCTSSRANVRTGCLRKLS